MHCALMVQSGELYSRVPPSIAVVFVNIHGIVEQYQQVLAATCLQFWRSLDMQRLVVHRQPKLPVSSCSTCQSTSSLLVGRCYYHMVFFKCVAVWETLFMSSCSSMVRPGLVFLSQQSVGILFFLNIIYGKMAFPHWWICCFPLLTFDL